MKAMRMAFVVLVSALTALVIPVEYASAQAGAPARPREAAAAASRVTQDLQEAVRALHAALPTDVSKNGFELRQRLDLLAQTLAYLGFELTGRTYGDLEGRQRDFFTDADAAVASWKTSSRMTVGDVSRVLAGAYDVFETIPGASRAPRVSSASPAYVPLRPSSTEPVVVTVSGSRLGTGDPTLRFGGRKCTLRRHRSAEIVFACSARMFIASQSPSAKIGTLTVYHRRTFLGAFLQHHPRPHEYRVTVFAVPPIMGSYKVSAVRTMRRIEEIQRQTPDFSHANDFCEGAREVVWSVESTPGWAIDVSSIVVEDLAKSGETQSRRAFDRTGSGFRFGGMVGNSGSCVSGPDGTRTQDVRGSLRARATYREYRPVSVDVLLEVREGQIPWGDDVSVPLPEASKGFEVEVRQIDGKRFVESTLPANHPWFSVSLDPQGREIVIHPKDVAAALD